MDTHEIPATTGLHIRTKTIPEVELPEEGSSEYPTRARTRVQVLSYEAALLRDGLNLPLETRLNVKMIALIGPSMSGKTSIANALLARNNELRRNVQEKYRLPSYRTLLRCTNRPPRPGDEVYYRHVSGRSIGQRLRLDRQQREPRIYEAHTHSEYWYLLYRETIEEAIREDALFVLPTSLETARALKMLFPGLHICMILPQWWLEEAGHFGERARTLRPEWTAGIEEWRFQYAQATINMIADRSWGQKAFDSIYVPPRFTCEELQDIKWRELVAGPAAIDLMEIFYGQIGQMPPRVVENGVSRAFADFGRLKDEYRRFVESQAATIERLAKTVELYDRYLDPVELIRITWELPGYQFISPGRRLLPEPYSSYLPGG